MNWEFVFEKMSTFASSPFLPLSGIGKRYCVRSAMSLIFDATTSTGTCDFPSKTDVIIL
jgi:hypothetical protein